MVHAMIRSLDLSFVIASKQNQGELIKLLDVIESTDFSAAPNNQARRGNRRVGHYPGRTSRGVDYLLYYS